MYLNLVIIPYLFCAVIIITEDCGMSDAVQRVLRLCCYEMVTAFIAPPNASVQRRCWQVCEPARMAARDGRHKSRPAQGRASGVTCTQCWVARFRCLNRAADRLVPV